MPEADSWLVKAVMLVSIPLISVLMDPVQSITQMMSAFGVTSEELRVRQTVTVWPTAATGGFMLLVSVTTWAWPRAGRNHPHAKRTADRVVRSNIGFQTP